MQVSGDPIVGVSSVLEGLFLYLFLLGGGKQMLSSENIFSPNPKMYLNSRRTCTSFIKT